MVFECPLLFGTVDQAQVVKTGTLLGTSARAQETGDSDGGEQSDDGDDNHDFHQRKASEPSSLF